MTAYHHSLSGTQMDALAQIKSWLDNDTSTRQVFRLFGYAGTGKTTLARHIAGLVDDQVAYAAFSGKAALMMANNGCDGARTLHSLIYQPVGERNGSFNWTLKNSGDIFDAKLIIVDEVSMIDDYLASDLLHFGIPVLAMGDPFQLPPIGEQGVFSSTAPDVILTEVHRQTAGNPVLQIAMELRNGNRPQIGIKGTSSVIEQEQLTEEDLMAADQIIVGTNATRWDYNMIMRTLHGFTGDLPVKGERIICLKNHERFGLMNGETFRVLSAPNRNGDDVTLELASETNSDCPFVVTMSAEQFLSGKAPAYARNNKPAFDFAYAITCHKAQGSQWRNVLVVDESRSFPEHADRWLYTAVTRAQECVTIAI
jgi:exodeoxyribonuclease V